MEIIPFVNANLLVENTLWQAGPLASGDETDILKITEDQADVTMHIYGTFGGSTVSVQGSLLGTQFNTVDDAYGLPMSYSSAGAIKPIGPVVKALKVTVTGGAGVSVFVNVLTTKTIYR